MPQKTIISLLFLLLLLFCITGSAQNIDIELLRKINPTVPKSLFWHVLSSSVSPVVIGLPVLIYLTGFLKQRSKIKTGAIWLATAILVALIITQVLKYTIVRDRPFITYPHDIFPFDHFGPGLSFPSQHTSFAFATATALSLQYRKWWLAVISFAWAILVGYSRLYLGQHYPSDVVAGVALGTGSAFLILWLANKSGFKK
jgi:membrane-associated phospholipid phosphatase